MQLLDIIANKKKLIENFSYVSALEFFVLLAPLITYPYLVRVIGRDLYGIVILSQVLASYASIIIDFGTNRVCAKHVSQNRFDKAKLSEIISSILCFRFSLWILCLVIYLLIVYLITSYREYWCLFFISYFLTLNETLFPQFFFQGIEDMKYTSIINILIKLFFISAVFIIVKDSNDYLWIPALYSIGYCVAGVVSLYNIFHIKSIKFYIPNFKTIFYYIKDSTPLFLTDLLLTIKGKLSYILIGAFVSVSNIVIYDLGYKFNSLLNKPLQVISIVLFPRFAKNKNISVLKKVICFTFVLSVFFVTLLNLFLPMIVKIFIDETIDLWPIRILSLAPIFHSIGYLISQNLFVAFGFNKYLLYSMILSIAVYLSLLIFMLSCGHYLSLYSFIIMDMGFYITEFLYRFVKGTKLIRCIDSKSTI